MNYKLLTFLLLGILTLEMLVFLYSDQKDQSQCIGGNYVVMYSDLPQFEGIKVYYGSCVKYQGTSSANLIKVCENDICRKPYYAEIKQDRYLPQSPLKK